MMNKKWEFWIDVGGTFTDCIAKSPGGVISTCKLLSSGVFKGTINEENFISLLSFNYPKMTHFVDGFFIGYKIKFLDLSGNLIEENWIESFKAEDGIFILKDPFKIDQSYCFELSSGEPSPIVGIRFILKKGLKDKIGKISLRFGTTHGTNALLERKGANVLFITTHGFKDILKIGEQNRAHLFKLKIEKPKVLHKNILEI